MANFSDYIKRRTRRNVIINGNFNIAQRGVGPFTTNGYHLDRWMYWASNDGAFSVTQSTSVPNLQATASLLLTQTTGDASLAAGQYGTFLYRVEGYDFLPFVGQIATLSFWVRATVPGTYSVGFRSGGNDKSYVAEYTVNSSNTWEYKTINVVFDYSGGTWNYGTSLGLSLLFVVGSGTTYQTSSIGQWLTGNYFASSNQVNGLASNNNLFGLSQVQFELGSLASAYEHISIDEELYECFRYYQWIYYNHAAATSTGTGNGVLYCNLQHHVKRATPTTIGLTSPSMWSRQNGWRTPTNTATNTSFNALNILFVWTDTGVTNYVAGDGLLLQAQCYIDAEL